MNPEPLTVEITADTHKAERSIARLKAAIEDLAESCDKLRSIVGPVAFEDLMLKAIYPLVKIESTTR